MRPESGCSNPMVSFSNTDLPDPAAPKTIFVSPRSRPKLMSRSTTFSSNCKVTRSNPTTVSGVDRSVI